jgi:acyl-CoA dehydrogenase
MTSTDGISTRAHEIAERVERFVREIVVPYEKDPRRDAHGPSNELTRELKDKARTAGVLTLHIRADGSHLTHLETALVLRKSGLSPLGPLACNTAGAR